MIQLIGLRKFTPKNGPDAGKEKTYDAFHDKNWRAPSVKDLFENLDKYLDMIPEKDRWNMFYTIARCKAEKRKFDQQDVLAFDFDKIDNTQLEKYVKIIHQVLEVPEEATARVSSGNGLHVILQLAVPFTSVDFFEENRHHYKAVANRINFALASAGLPGGTDTSIFGPAKILRLPGTINRKPDRPDTRAELLKATMLPVNFSLDKLSGLPSVQAKDQLSERAMKRFKKADNDAVLTGCEFMKWAKANPNDLDEPTWYAMLSIAGRLENGKEVAHDLSRGHKSYDPQETDQKLEQALDASGPRTCDNINALWGKCSSCPNFKKKASPILLVGEGHIGTEHTGFHNIYVDGKGNEKCTPNLEDLRLYLKREKQYKNLKGTGICYEWNGTHYEDLPHTTLEGFAYDKFEPKVTMKTCADFRKLVTITEETPITWFEDSTERKANFLNGYYDFDLKQFLPHTPSVGFRSVLPFNYDPNAKSPMYDKMLEKITCGVKALQDVLDEVGGYAISGDRYWLHKAAVLVGEGSNGKSTWLNVMKAVVGRGNYSSIGIRDMQKSEYYKQMLDKKLVNIAEEMPTTSLTETGLFKALTSGLEVPVRSPYEKPYEIRNKAKMIFTCNELPTARDTTHGFFRRLLIVPFNYRFSKNDPEFDPHIEEKLLSELPGIFNRFLKGYMRLAAKKDFTDCKLIDMTAATYHSEVDTVATWVNENVKTYALDSNEGKFIPMRQFYTEYCTDLQAIGEKPMNHIIFGRTLSKIIADYEQRFECKWIEKHSKARGLKNVDIIRGVGIDHTPSPAKVVHIHK